MFQPYTVYAEVGQLKINNNKVMYHLSIKLCTCLIKFPLIYLTTEWQNLFQLETISKLDLEPKGQVHSQRQNIFIYEARNNVTP